MREVTARTVGLIPDILSFFKTKLRDTGNKVTRWEVPICNGDG